jgi:hypothetical protein
MQASQSAWTAYLLLRCPFNRRFEEEFVDFSTWASQGRQAAINRGEYRCATVLLLLQD